MATTDETKQVAALSASEKSIVQHVSRWGSDGYPITKVGRRWHWNEMFGVRGAPVSYKTKRAAVQAFENFHDLLLDKAAGRV